MHLMQNGCSIADANMVPYWCAFEYQSFINIESLTRMNDRIVWIMYCWQAFYCGIGMLGEWLYPSESQDPACDSAVNVIGHASAPCLSRAVTQNVDLIFLFLFKIFFFGTNLSVVQFHKQNFVLLCMQAYTSSADPSSLKHVLHTLIAV